MPLVKKRLVLTCITATVTSFGCGERIPNAPYVPSSSQTAVRYDPTSPLLNDVPWPNDGLCWLNSQDDEPCLPNVAIATLPAIISDWVSSVNDTPGWATTSTLYLPFRRADDAFAGPALDLSRFLTVQRDTDFTNDAIYLIDLATGLPVPLDYGSALSSVILREPVALDPSDSHRDSPSLLVETEDERYDETSGTIIPAQSSDDSVTGSSIYRPEWDRDSDGVLDVPVYEQGQHCIGNQSDASSDRAARARCLADNLVAVYDPILERLQIRPRAPLRESTTYALVVTNRLLDNRQRPIVSPFATAYHPSQKASGGRVEATLSKLDSSAYYGSLAGTGLTQVPFLFTFTTASPVTDFRKLASALSNTSSKNVVDGFESLELDRRCGTSTLRAALVESLSRAFELDLGERKALDGALSNISSVVKGTYFHSNFVQFGTESIRLRQTSATETIEVPFVLTIPKTTDSPGKLSVVVVAHDVNTNRLDGFRFAGQAAHLGLGFVLYDRYGARSPLSRERLESIRKVVPTDCFKALESVLVPERSDTNELATSPVSIDVLTTRDRWRASAIELWQLTQALKDASSSASWAENFPRLQLTGLLGEGEGGALVGLAETLPNAPKTIVVVDPMTSPARAWSRGSTWGMPVSERLSIFGPRIAGVLASQLPPIRTNCSASESSLRVLSSSQDYLGSEFGCLPLQADSGVRFPKGATVVVTNVRTLERRCVGMTNLGEFSLGIPTATGDSLELLVYDGMDLVPRFGRNDECSVEPKRSTLALVRTIPNDPKRDPTIAAGLGLERQSVEFRNALDWAEAAFAPANPTTFFAELGHSKPGSDATGTLILLSPGDPLVLPDEGLSVAVASGLVPNLPADSLITRPELAFDTTPTLLAGALKFPTVEQAIADGHLAESAPWLIRHDPAPVVCGVNRVDVDTLPDICRPGCATDTDCPVDSYCNAQRCEPHSIGDDLCAQSLYDEDYLAGDVSGLNAQNAVEPLRLGRYAGSPTSKNLASLWQPRATASSTDASVPTHPDWPLTVLSVPLSNARGAHGIPTDNVCQRFRFGTYVPHLISRFLLTDGTAFPPITNWGDHSCLEKPLAKQVCSFLDSN